MAAAMETISCYWLHISLSSILQSELLLLVMKHLSNESLQNYIADALSVLVCRKVGVLRIGDYLLNGVCLSQDDINSYYKERYQVTQLLICSDMLDLVDSMVR